MSFRFLHLDTRFGGRERTRRRLREATLEAFDRAVELVLSRGLHALLIAGDAFDDPLLSRRTELRFARALERLARAGAGLARSNAAAPSAGHRAGPGSGRPARGRA